MLRFVRKTWLYLFGTLAASPTFLFSFIRCVVIEMVKQEHKRVNIHISKKAHMQAKMICALENSTLNKYFEQAILRALKQDKNKLKEVFDDA